MEANSAIVDLRRLAGSALDDLLEEEKLEFRQELDWDFSTAGRLVRQLVDARALAGCGLLHGAVVTGYGYSIVEEHKGLIGDLYIRPAWRTLDAENSLFIAILDDLIATPDVYRVESQLLFADLETAGAIARMRPVTVYERALLTLDCEAGPPPHRRAPLQRFRLEPWNARFAGSAAEAISSAYHGHIDSRMNDEYLSPDGVRRVLDKIVRPGCGFSSADSFAAFDVPTNRPSGVILASFVAPETGHISELCVAANDQGAGLGYELLSRAVESLRDHGAKRVNLTVSAVNTDAIRLYERYGFRETRRFFAYAWERPGASR